VLTRAGRVVLGLAVALGGCGVERPGLVRHDAPYIATPEQVGEAMLRLADVSATDVVYDLGSGDGRLVIAAAREFGARAVGVEIQGELVQNSREQALKAGVADRVRFLWEDLFATDLTEATVVTLYLGEEVNLRLRPRLLASLRPGTRVVSHRFRMGEWNPDRVQHARGPGGDYPLYLWIVPGDVAGTWQATLGDGSSPRPARLQVQQQFQQLSGTLEIEDRRLPLRGTVAGTAVELSAEGWAFGGQVMGHQATGRVTERGGPSIEWQARRTPPR
jgi:SAM-dependent methyltransferase